LPELDVNNTSVSLSERRVTIARSCCNGRNSAMAQRRWQPEPAAIDSATKAATTSPASAPAPATSAAPTAPAWNIALEKLELQDANIAWRIAASSLLSRRNWLRSG